ncbi:PepSY-associated TM helix domain-containing protein [Thalassotalea aquiviva]|uniref:PepSY-associated TM helix domain-containing protein n=1 Tax=Thalassotalea aquiviva TaxID=3242415 RepID=UPI00352A7254
MRNKPQRSVHVKMIKHLRESHRLLGIWLAVFLIFLALSGIFINHANSLKLDKTGVSWSWLHDHYGIKSPQKFQTYPLHEQAPAYVLDQQVWWQGTLLLDAQAGIKGIELWAPFILIASEERLYIFNQAGELVDILDALSQLPTNITHLAVRDHTIYLNTTDGVFASYDEMYSWQSVETEQQVAWPIAGAVDEQLKPQLAKQFKSKLLTWERVILDLHSGRFFGDIGVLLMDMVAILIIILSATGVYMWVRQERARKR